MSKQSTDIPEIRRTLLGQALRKLLCLVLGHYWKPAVEEKPMYRKEGRFCLRCFKIVWEKTVNLP